MPFNKGGYIVNNADGCPYSEFLTLNNNLITRNMIVNGSVINQNFWVQAGILDFYIKTISIVISAPNAALNNFGAGAILLNGIEVSSDCVQGNIIIEPKLQSNFDFVQWAVGQPSFGDAATVFEASNVVATSDALYLQ